MAKPAKKAAPKKEKSKATEPPLCGVCLKRHWQREGHKW